MRERIRAENEAFRESLKPAYAPVSNLAEHIVKPGIDKHLVPLCLYMGTRSMARIHMMWNLSLGMFAQECGSIGNGVKLAHNPKFSHLCGPDKKPDYSQIRGFFNRLRLNPRVTDNIPGFTEYAEWVLPRPFNYYDVPLESNYKGCAAWRTYVGPKKKLVLVKPLGIAAPDALYPYIMHDGKTDAGVDLVKEVNRIVPRHLPEEFRADVCQDIICAVLAGETTIAELEGADVRKFVSTARSIFASKWDHISIDDTTDDFGRPFLDTFDAERMAAVH